MTPIGTKIPDPKPITQSTESSRRQGKLHVPEDPESDPLLSDSSSSESYLYNDRKYRKSKNNKRDKNKKTPQTHETGLVILIVDRL